jgi:dienelactone hydrolase
MTATTKPASNGSTTIATAKKERLSGMARIREGEIYHTTGVMHDAIYEADRLCAEIYRAITDAYFGRNGEDQSDAETRTITQIAESAQVQKQVDEALSCLAAAQTFLQRLISEPPF